MKRFFLILLGMFMSATMLTGCGYNEIQTLDESTKAAWSEVLNQYQRRNDLIPNVVNSVKGEADFEKSTLTQVINARAKATSIQATPELMENPEAFQKFTQAQGELSSALSRLLVTVERYPDLKANKAFQDLRVQLEGKRYEGGKCNYIRQFPQMVWVWILGYKPKAQYAVADEAAITTPPKVDFNGSAATAPAKP